MAADLVDLTLEVVYDLRGELVPENFEQIDFLVARDGLVGSQLNAFLYLQRNKKTTLERRKDKKHVYTASKEIKLLDFFKDKIRRYVNLRCC